MTITIVLPFLPPSLNRVAGRGPYNYREAKERFTDLILKGKEAVDGEQSH